MAFITNETYYIRNKVSYEKSILPLKEQKLINIEHVQKKTFDILIDELTRYFGTAQYDVEHAHIEILYLTDILKFCPKYIEPSHSNDGCIICGNFIPYFSVSLWNMRHKIRLIKKISDTHLTTSLQQYSYDDLYNYAYMTCSKKCKNKSIRKCKECYSHIKPMCISSFCNDDCSYNYDRRTHYEKNY